MKQIKTKVPETWYVPQLDDISNIHPRLIQLQEKLKNSYPYDAGIILAKGLVDAAMMLNSVNFDLMKAVVDALDEASNNASRYDLSEKENTRQLYTLAIDILVDVPISQFIPDPTKPLPPIELEDDIENVEIKELVFRYGQAYQTRFRTDIADDFWLERNKQCEDLLQEIRQLGVSTENIQTVWKEYFDLGRDNRAIHGLSDENLPDVRGLIRDYENSLEDECTAPNCDCITFGCCAKEVESENLALEQKQFTVGQRVRLTRDLPPMKVLDMGFSKGDEGVVAETSIGEYGFSPDKLDDKTILISQIIDGQYHRVLNFCEAVEPNYQCPSQCSECEAPAPAIYKEPSEFSSTGYFWQCAVCNSTLAPAPAPVKLENGGAK